MKLKLCKMGESQQSLKRHGRRLGHCRRQCEKSHEKKTTGLYLTFFFDMTCCVPSWTNACEGIGKKFLMSMKQTNQNAPWPNQPHESKSFENDPTRDFHMECSSVRWEKHILDGSLAKPVHIHKGSGSHVDFCPRPCSSTCRWVRFSTPRHSGPHSACNPCSCAHFGHVTAACHRRRDWALSKGSHMQQEMDIFLRRLHILGAPPPSSITVHLRKPRHKKLVIVSPETWLSFVIVTTRVFRPVGRIFHRDHQT